MLWKINTVYFLTIGIMSILYPGWLVPLFMLCMGSSLYWVHRLGHTRIWPLWFEAHVVGHHLQQYPSKNFSSHVYRLNTWDKYQLNTWAYVVVALLNLYLFNRWLHVTAPGLLYLIVLTLLFVAAEDRIHDLIHTTCDPEKLSPWLSYLWHMHRQHHSGNMKHNYAVLSLWLDWLYGSLSKN